MKRFCMMLAVLVGMAAWTFAEGEAAQGANAEAKKEGDGKPKIAPEMTDMQVTGTLEKVEVKGKDGAVHHRFVLTDAAGNKIGVNPGRKEGEAELESFVGKMVTITGKGVQKPGKDGKMMG
jgi:hypothetical protein